MNSRKKEKRQNHMGNEDEITTSARLDLSEKLKRERFFFLQLKKITINNLFCACVSILLESCLQSQFLDVELLDKQLNACAVL